MQSLKQLCKPHASVFDTQRRDAVLDLTDLIEDKIEPDEFFEDNYITEGILNIPDEQPILPGNLLTTLNPPDKRCLQRLFLRLFSEHHLFIRRIIRRTRQQFEEQIDSETNEPLLQPIGVELFGEGDDEAIRFVFSGSNFIE